MISFVRFQFSIIAGYMVSDIGRDKFNYYRMIDHSIESKIFCLVAGSLIQVLTRVLIAIARTLVKFIVGYRAKFFIAYTLLLTVWSLEH